MFRHLAPSPAAAAVEESQVETGAAGAEIEVDAEYPGTAVKRLRAVVERAKSLTPEQLNGDWENVRVNILWAGGLKDIRNAPPGYGYTGHSFND